MGAWASGVWNGCEYLVRVGVVLVVTSRVLEGMPTHTSKCVSGLFAFRLHFECCTSVNFKCVDIIINHLINWHAKQLCHNHIFIYHNTNEGFVLLTAGTVLNYLYDEMTLNKYINIIWKYLKIIIIVNNLIVVISICNKML